MSEKTAVRTEEAPAPFRGAPYNQAIVAGELVFVAGQLGLTPDGEMVEGGIGPQTEQTMRNIAAILEAAGTGMDRLLKTTVFLTDLGNFAGMNEVYATHVGDTPPARSTIEIGSLPSGGLVEIEAIAAR
jgi:2-iminobutanoate/2-iminopropanoate deaminase